MLPSWALAPISPPAGCSQAKREASCVARHTHTHTPTGLHGHRRETCLGADAAHPSPHVKAG